MEPEVVLITGCSTGIGRATATTLTGAGYEVVATARRPEELDGIGAVMALPLDVTDERSIETAVRAVLERYRRIDVLINNAGQPPGWPRCTAGSLTRLITRSGWRRRCTRGRLATFDVPSRPSCRLIVRRCTWS